MPIFVGAGTSSFMKGGDGSGHSIKTTTQRDGKTSILLTYIVLIKVQRMMWTELGEISQFKRVKAIYSS